MIYHVITSGSNLIKALEFKESSANVILKLFEQAGTKTFEVSGDGSTTTVLLAADLLRNSLRFLVNGYNPVFLSNGLKRIAFFLMDKINEFSLPVSDHNQMIGVLKTSLGNNLTDNLFQFIKRVYKKY